MLRPSAVGVFDKAFFWFDFHGGGLSRSNSHVFPLGFVLRFFGALSGRSAFSINDLYAKLLKNGGCCL